MASLDEMIGSFRNQGYDFTPIAGDREWRDWRQNLQVEDDRRRQQEENQRRGQQNLFDVINQSSPTLNTSYKPGSLPSNNTQNADLSKWENLKPALRTGAGQLLSDLVIKPAANLVFNPTGGHTAGEYTEAELRNMGVDKQQAKDAGMKQVAPGVYVDRFNRPYDNIREPLASGLQASLMRLGGGNGFVRNGLESGLGNLGGSYVNAALNPYGEVEDKTVAAPGNFGERLKTANDSALGNFAFGAALGGITGGKSKGGYGAMELIDDLSAPKQVKNLIKKQNTLEGVLKVIDEANMPAPAAPRSTAMSIADDFSPSERAVFEAMNDPKIPQPDKFDAGLRAYKTVNPTATPQEAADATFSVLRKAGNESIGGVKKAFGQVDIAADTGIKNTGVKAKVREIFNPIKNLSDDTQKSFQKAAAGRYVGQTERATTINEIRQTAKQTGTKLDMDLAHKIESGEVDDVFTRQFREVADKARQEGIDAGLDIGYKENYLPHIWKQSEEKVDEIARGFGMKPRATGERIIPTYEEGLKLGLTPKYKDPADMMGDYVQNIQNARANVALIGDLKAQGMIAEASGRPPAGWAHVTAEAFPKSSSGNQLMAPKEVADVLNNLYGTKQNIIEKALGKTARFNSIWQDIALAGGVPKTPANFFTFSQMMKEGATGLGDILTGHPVRGSKTLLNPLGAFITSFSKGSTAKIQVKNKDFLRDLAQAGAPINFSTEGKKLVSWDSMFNDPTFGRFMPTMQLGTAKNIYGGLERKLGAEKAMQETASIMKKLYGITDQLMTGRSGAVQDLIGSVGFAPKYRESIVNVLGNTVKSLDPRTYKDVSYSLNRRLAAGMGVTFLIYDQINRQTTGHGMFQNPSGKELQLAIPYGEDEKGNKKVLYIPFMPSFMTLPRAAVGAAQSIAKGDMGGVGSELGKMLSMPLQVGSQLASNRDYFGRPIVIDEKASQETGESIDSGIDKLKKQALYLMGQSSPAAVRAGLDYAQGKPLEQVLAQAGEVPVRFGKFYSGKGTGNDVAPGQVSGDFYKVYNVLESQSRKMEKDINKDIYQGTGSNAKEFANQYNNRVNEMFANFFAQYGDKLKDEDRKKYESMADNIKIEVKDKKKGGLYVNKY